MSVLENIDDFWTIDKINEIDLSCEPEIKLQIGWCFLNCNCGKRTNSAIQLKYNFFLVERQLMLFVMNVNQN